MKKPFIDEETSIKYKHMKIYLISLIIKEMQIKIDNTFYPSDWEKL